jgi:hypothetical protein
LTTNRWSRNNKLDYSIVTGYIITRNNKHISILLDIIELSNAIYNSVYLAKKLLKVIDRFRIISSIISVTQDNASPNNIMLVEFKAAVAEQYNTLDKDSKA